MRGKTFCLNKMNGMLDDHNSWLDARIFVMIMISSMVNDHVFI